MYYVAVPTLAQAVLGYIRKHALLKAGDRVGIAVSGGADSVALLRLLLELREEIGIVLSVVHFNHQLRGAESETDERFVAELAHQHRLDLHCGRGDVAELAASKRLSLEAAARQMRYQYFRELLQGPVNRIATGHTLDDQAETVLLRVVRGAGSRGLAGIYPQLSASTQHSAVSTQRPTIVRPLLAIRHGDLATYLKSRKQEWREDASNRDLRHARNRIRHGILPRLERHLNPAVREALADTAEIARAEEDYWGREVARVLPTVQAGAAGAMSLKVLSGLPLALQRRVARAVAESLGLRLDFRQVQEILNLDPSGSHPSKTALLPDGWAVSQAKGQLRFARETPPETAAAYEYPLPAPGAVEVREVGSRFEVVLVSGKSAKGYNPEHLLSRALLGDGLRVRNWRPGDRFWPAHTKTPKKIKELLQERHVDAALRKQWPVVINGEDVVWVRGFSVPARLQPRSAAGEAVLIREIPMDTRRQPGGNLA